MFVLPFNEVFSAAATWVVEHPWFFLSKYWNSQISFLVCRGPARFLCRTISTLNVQAGVRASGLYGYQSLDFAGKSIFVVSTRLADIATSFRNQKHLKFQKFLFRRKMTSRMKVRLVWYFLVAFGYERLFFSISMFLQTSSALAETIKLCFLARTYGKISCDLGLCSRFSLIHYLFTGL